MSTQLAKAEAIYEARLLMQSRVLEQGLAFCEDNAYLEPRRRIATLEKQVERLEREVEDLKQPQPGRH